MLIGNFWEFQGYFEDVAEDLRKFQSVSGGIRLFTGEFGGMLQRVSGTFQGLTRILEGCQGSFRGC